jgi:hypothetical protein
MGWRDANEGNGPLPVAHRVIWIDLQVAFIQSKIQTALNARSAVKSRPIRQMHCPA